MLDYLQLALSVLILAGVIALHVDLHAPKRRAGDRARHPHKAFKPVRAHDKLRLTNL